MDGGKRVLTEAELAEAAPALRVIDRVYKAFPARLYQPHEHGQIQFHQSKHRIRAMFPGNRFGKTRAMATEAAWWLGHSHPYNKNIPNKPIQVVWTAPQFKQFEMLKPMIEGSCLPAGWSWNGQDNVYSWPDGSKFFVIPQDRDWHYVQGINPHLVCFDEEPNLPLWREMLVRQFGENDTHYVLAATATMGASWMEDQIYKPWSEFHAARGLDTARAMVAQLHPTIWCWASGGIADNPTMSADQIGRARDLIWSNPKEREVRLHGGFADWSGDCIFSDEGLAIQAKNVRPGTLGFLRVKA
jgi:hypothetical protein